jgi:hypothetical protein
VPDVSGTFDEREDVAEPAKHAVGAQEIRELGRGVDPVLEGEDAGALADERAQGLRSLGHLPRLDADQDDVDWTDRGRVIGGSDGMEVEVALHTLDVQAVLADGGQVPAAGDEPHVRPRFGEAPAEVRADRAGSEHPEGEITHCLIVPSHTFDDERRRSCSRDVQVRVTKERHANRNVEC